MSKQDKDQSQTRKSGALVCSYLKHAYGINLGMEFLVNVLLVFLDFGISKTD
jgi:hypothetical protein